MVVGYHHFRKPPYDKAIEDMIDTVFFLIRARYYEGDISHHGINCNLISVPLKTRYDRVKIIGVDLNALYSVF